jgi:general secretion pathway protein G
MSRKGFTLIELMIVMVIISILIGAVLPRFRGMQDEANNTRAQSELRTMQLAVESYYINQNPKAYPVSTTTPCATYLNSASPLIIGEVLYDPFLEGGVEYNYILSDDARYYVVFSVGIDGTADITGIADDGYLTGAENDDIFVTNGFGFLPD